MRVLGVGRAHVRRCQPLLPRLPAGQPSAAGVYDHRVLQESMERIVNVGEGALVATRSGGGGSVRRRRLTCSRLSGSRATRCSAAMPAPTITSSCRGSACAGRRPRGSARVRQRPRRLTPKNMELSQGQWHLRIAHGGCRRRVERGAEPKRGVQVLSSAFSEPMCRGRHDRGKTTRGKPSFHLPPPPLPQHSAGAVPLIHPIDGLAAVDGGSPAFQSSHTVRLACSTIPPKAGSLPASWLPL